MLRSGGELLAVGGLAGSAAARGSIRLRTGESRFGTPPHGAESAVEGAAADATRSTAGFEPLGRVSVPGTREAVVTPAGDVAAVATMDGYATVDLSDPTAPQVLAERGELLAERTNGPLVEIQDVKLDGETLAVVGPANARDEATVHGAVLVDISDPAEPVQVGVFETDYPIHNCAFADGYLYLTAAGSEDDADPLVIVDASDPTEPVERARWRLTDAVPEWTDTPSILRALHDVWVRDGLAAVAFWDTGTHLLDVSEPAEPTYLGTATAFTPEELASASERQLLYPPGNHHYAATDAENELLAVGKESQGQTDGGEIVGGPGGITLYDVSDPTNPTRCGTIEPPAPEQSVRLSGIWTTAHNFTLHDGVLYASWYDGGVTRHDVSDPANPERLSWYANPGTVEFWTARVVGDTVVGAAKGSGLSLFPDTDGLGGDRTLLTETPTPTGTRTPRRTPTPRSTPQETADTTEPSDTTAEPDTTDTRTDATDASGPGLGVLTAVGALGVTAWRRLKRTESGEE